MISLTFTWTFVEWQITVGCFNYNMYYFILKISICLLKYFAAVVDILKLLIDSGYLSLGYGQTNLDSMLSGM